MIWEAIGGNEECELDTSQAHIAAGLTRYEEMRRVVILGADVYENPHASDVSPVRDRMSNVAVLAHEMAHAKRHRKEYNRSIDMPDMLIDEAETSLEASFNPNIAAKDKRDLIEDAKNQLVARLNQPFT
jgi:hypothetical protein